MRRRIFILPFAILLAVCADSSTDTEPLPLDEPLAPGAARAGRISRASELIGGETARGAIGDFKIYNDRIQVVIADVRATPGFHPYGGIILDADVVRAAGEPGRSTFGEVVAALDLVVQRPERVEVIDDGSSGQGARIRATGGIAPLPLFQAIVGSLFPNQQYDVEWQIDYVLEPHADWLRIEHSVMNRAREDIGLAPVGGFFFGTGAQPFVDGAGFARAKMGFSYDYYGAVGPQSCYLYGVPGSEISALFGESGLVVTTMGEAIELRARERKTWEHVLVVGDGDIAASWASWRKLSGASDEISVRGLAKDSAGQPIRSARVHALRSDAIDLDRDYATQTLVEEDGTFELELPAGNYTLLAATDERLVSEPVQVSASADVELIVEQTGAIELRVTDGEDRALPIKISVQGGSPAPITAEAKFGEREHGSNLARTEFSRDGTGRIELVPGSYTVYFSRGGEYEIAEHEVQIAAGETIVLESMLVRSVDSTGWMTTDPHLHARLSPDSPDSDVFKVRALAAESIELPISTEHDAVNDFNPAVRALGLEAWINGISGTEVTTIQFGHFNAFPVTPDPTKPGNGRLDWFGLSPAETFALARSLPDDPFLQVNHPRSTTIGYFEKLQLDRTTLSAGDAFSFDFDGFEVLNGCGNGSMEQSTVLDWFAFLNAGKRILATGSSDDHRAGHGTLGFPVTYVRMPTDEPALADATLLRDAFHQGRLVVSCGPFLELRADGAEIGDLIAPAGDRITLNARVAAPSWMDIDELAVIMNGTVVQRIPLSGVEATRFDGPIEVPIAAGTDGWIIVWASGDQRHGIWAQNRPSYAFTNPIFIDGDRDGDWMR